jgi:hypothetical protein
MELYKNEEKWLGQDHASKNSLNSQGFKNSYQDPTNQKKKSSLATVVYFNLEHRVRLLLCFQL